MSLADEVKRKRAERQQQAQRESETHQDEADELIAILDELSPEVVSICQELAVVADMVGVPGITGLKRRGWVVSLVGLSDPPVAIAFYENQPWEFANLIGSMGTRQFQAEMRWPALSGFAGVLLGKSKAELERAISDDIAGC